MRTVRARSARRLCTTLGGSQRTERHTKTHRLYALLQQLEQAQIHYTLARVRGDTVMVCATVPGRRYEIEVFSDGNIEVEVFGAGGHIGGEEVVEDLIANYSDDPESTA